MRLRLGERPSSNPTGDDDCGPPRDESNSIGSGSAFQAEDFCGGKASSGETGELSSMMSCVERFLATLGLITNAGVAKYGPA